jgi:hypothetical protein
MDMSGKHNVRPSLSQPSAYLLAISESQFEGCGWWAFRITQRVMKGYDTNAAPLPVCVFPQEGAYVFYLRYVDFSVRQAVCPSPAAIGIQPVNDESCRAI